VEKSPSYSSAHRIRYRAWTSHFYFGALGEAALFIRNLALTARESAKEAAAEGVAMTFAPMLDIARDPRWGSSAEGRERILGSARALRRQGAWVSGRQPRGGGFSAAVAKHYCAYGAVTAGRDYASVDISERTLREVHMPPFARPLPPGGGHHARIHGSCGHTHDGEQGMLRGWLRGRWGFKGVIVSDYNAVAESFATALPPISRRPPLTHSMPA